MWEWPNYPQYYIPLADVDRGVLVDEHHEQHLSRGTAAGYGLRVGDIDGRRGQGLHRRFDCAGLAGTVRFDWDALDAWFEEDEQVFVHPRNPYARVDALRSTRPVRVELDGVVLAESSSPVMVFETGLPTRYYLNRTEVDFAAPRRRPTPSPPARTRARTSGYWSVAHRRHEHADLAWSYDFPTASCCRSPA